MHIRICVVIKLLNVRTCSDLYLLKLVSQCDDVILEFVLIGKDTTKGDMPF